jgi:hypothetical protein
VTGVKANPTDKGVEVILETAQGEQLQVTNRSEGNNCRMGIAYQIPQWEPEPIRHCLMPQNTRLTIEPYCNVVWKKIPEILQPAIFAQIPPVLINETPGNSD